MHYIHGELVPYQFCKQQQMDMLKVIVYVAWSLESLPHVSNRYVAYSKGELGIIPFEMIHGRNNPGQKCKNMRTKKLKKINLWEEDVGRLIFED